MSFEHQFKPSESLPGTEFNLGSSIWNGANSGDFRNTFRANENNIAMSYLPLLQLFDNLSHLDQSDTARGLDFRILLEGSRNPIGSEASQAPNALSVAHRPNRSGEAHSNDQSSETHSQHRGGESLAERQCRERHSNQLIGKRHSPGDISHSRRQADNTNSHKAVADRTSQTDLPPKHAGNGNLTGMDQATLNQWFDRASANRSGKTDRLEKLSHGAVYLRSDMDVDADGSPRAKQIDPKGQTETSLTYKNGKAVNAEEIPYIVLPIGEHAKHGIKLGDVAAVRYNGKVAFAVFADRSDGKIGEGSMALARSLGINPDPRKGGVDQKHVEYLVFPGSGDRTPGTLAANNNRGAEWLKRVAQV
jgi:Fungal chitosanase.